MKTAILLAIALIPLAACANDRAPVPPGLETGIRGNGGGGLGGEAVVGKSEGGAGTLNRVQTR